MFSYESGVIAVNTVVTSKEAIMKTCRDMVSERGLSALDMRSVAKACHVALGSLYNYFPSKDALVTATIESVWQDIFHMEQCCEQKPFPEYVRWIFDSVRQGTREYPHFFTAHSISVASSAKEQARKTMEQYFSHMKAGMAQSLRADPAVRRDAFSASFSESDLIDFVLSNLLTLLARQEDDCEVLLEVIRRVLYPA
ncbi:TetR/AcrR family transcriptional regulator [uncultured Anaerotruncus sp.]|uniref:TetR/AcrR family transcriptional regulator n=1 Tax=Anaerotruncus massiliensis (ex Liu et al. 2021) TaxID=2321404 RepID=UPI002673DE73|nr:TetR/AcrR family transcriptional regulator [uncultured Anaerotruncus sp.]